MKIFHLPYSIVAVTNKTYRKDDIYLKLKLYSVIDALKKEKARIIKIRALSFN